MAPSPLRAAPRAWLSPTTRCLCLLASDQVSHGGASGGGQAGRTGSLSSPTPHKRRRLRACVQQQQQWAGTEWCPPKPLPATHSLTHGGPSLAHAQPQAASGAPCPLASHSGCASVPGRCVQPQAGPPDLLQSALRPWRPLELRRGEGTEASLSHQLQPLCPSCQLSPRLEPSWRRELLRCVPEQATDFSGLSFGAGSPPLCSPILCLD